VTPRGWLVLAGIVLLVVGGVTAGFRGEGSAPGIDAPERAVIGATPSVLGIDLVDAGSGLRELQVVLVHAGGEVPLLEERYPGSWLLGGSPPVTRLRLEVPVDVRGVEGVGDDAIVRIVARDWSWRGGFGGNTTRFDMPVSIDLDPPQIRVASGLTYVRRGGAGAVVYSVSEPTIEDGVKVAGASFRGFPLEPGQNGEVLPAGERFALFAVPDDVEAEPEIFVFARDAAGNLGTASWPAVVQERVMPEAQVTLNQTFLDTRLRPLARSLRIDASDSSQAFHEINTRVRQSNELEIRGALADPAGAPLWHGSFKQLPNSRVTSRFGERRRYFVSGREVSSARHLGYDLASTSATPIGASNAGRVVFAHDLGIYGNCVLIDHGMGLASLYGHMSRLDVKPGDRVEKGERIGLSGATGLAGGDHLHFAILVGDTYVDPLEWWDPKWVRTHIEERLVRSSP